MDSFHGLNPNLATRIVMLDLEGQCAGVDLELMRAILVAGRSAGLAIAHAYRSRRAADLSPVKGLSPLPNEPVFLRTEICAFSSRPLGAWVGPPSAPLVFLGRADAVQRSAATAAALGYQAYIFVTPANTNGDGLSKGRMHPYALGPFPASRPDLVQSSLSYVAWGAANGQS